MELCNLFLSDMARGKSYWLVLFLQSLCHFRILPYNFQINVLVKHTRWPFVCLFFSAEYHSATSSTYKFYSQKV